MRVNIRPTRIRKLPDQPIFEAFSQGIQPYVLDGNALLAGWAELAAPLGLADMNPVGRPVTGAREAVLFDKGFQQQRAVAIAVLPVPRKLPGRQPQYFGGEVVRADPRQDQEAGVVDDEMEVSLALPVVPADEAVARGALPGGGAKAQQRDQVLRPALI